MIQGFSYYFCMTKEGSGSGRPKNMWIRIRIRNTAALYTLRLPAMTSSSSVCWDPMQSNLKLIRWELRLRWARDRSEDYNKKLFNTGTVGTDDDQCSRKCK
jgi:hypothetical protein